MFVFRSLGALLYVLLYGFPPFFEDEKKLGRQKARTLIHQKIQNGFQPDVRTGM